MKIRTTEKEWTLFLDELTDLPYLDPSSQSLKMSLIKAAREKLAQLEQPYAPS